MPQIRIREIDNSGSAGYAENNHIILVPIQVDTPELFEDKLFSNAKEFENEYKDHIVTSTTLTGKVIENIIEAKVTYTEEDEGKLVEVLFIDVFPQHLPSPTGNLDAYAGLMSGYNSGFYKVVRIQDPDTGTYSYDVDTTESVYWISYDAPSEHSGKVATGEGGTYKCYDDAYTASETYNYVHKLLKLGLVFLVAPFSDVADLTYENFFEKYTDLGKYNIGFITLAGLTDKAICEAAIECAAVRGDAAALIDVPAGAESAADIIDLMASFSVEPVIRGESGEDFNTKESAYKYAALFAPTLTIENDLTLAYHSSFDYLACFAQSLTRFPDYFAVAGSVRGKSPFTGLGVSAIYGDLDVNKLQVRKPRSGEEEDGSKCCNVIYNCRPFGYVMWGNRTLEPVTLDGLKASHFLNIRVLCNDIKKELYRAARKYTFEPNSDVLWANFTNEITPLLDEMRSGQGIRGYKFVKEQTNEKAKLKARIKIIPIEAVEDFDLTLELTDSLEITE